MPGSHPSGDPRSIADAAGRHIAHAAGRQNDTPTSPRARAVMVVGTGSHAGKSVLAAALCRIYARLGYRVAPFKAQNMALNSYVTPEGGEIGRAQAYQARAAGVEPHVDMNPVLLKPSSHTGSQVIVLGRPVRHMAVREYHAFQAEVWPTVTAAFDRLRAANDLIVMEGAGSPAEINLRGHDIVNMPMALHAQAPTLLVGDIDRGGLFASLVGHMELFTEEERSLVAAFLVNKFRGDATLLDPGIEFLRARTGVPTLGVVPMLTDWRGDEEDSLGIEDRQRRADSDAPLQIAVVRLPFISNFTDFDALADEPDVNIRYVTTPGELEGATAIVLPGTKSTVADLAWLRRSGLAAAVSAQAAAGTPVVGVCGGYQMLGRRIHDPDHVESDAATVEGLGLLDVVTTFAGDKRTVRVEGELLPLEGSGTDPGGSGTDPGGSGTDPGGSALGPGGSALGPAGTPLHGYEIHMGRTRLGPSAAPLLRLRDADGHEHDDGAAGGAVCGSYVHGLFDRRELRTAFLDRLRTRVGLVQPQNGTTARGDDIDRLADHVAAHIDLRLLERIVGLETR
jgi:adenosylcobyric acid synthase